MFGVPISLTELLQRNSQFDAPPPQPDQQPDQPPQGQPRLIGAPQPNIEPAPSYPAGTNVPTNTDQQFTLEQMQRMQQFQQQQLQEMQQPGGLKRHLLGALQGMGDAAMKHSTGMTSAEQQHLQEQTAQLHEATQHLRVQTQGAILQNQMALRRMAAFEHFQDPFANFGPLSPEEKAIRDSSMQSVAQSGDIGHANTGINHIASLRVLQQRGEAQGKYATLEVTPEMVTAGAPAAWLGKQIPADQVLKWTSRSVFGNVAVSGAQGPALVNRNPMSPDFGQTTNLGLGNPSLATAQQTKLYPISRGGQVVYATPAEARGQIPANIPTAAALDDDPTSPTFGQTVLMTKAAAVGKVQLGGHERSRGGAARSAIDLVPKIVAEIDKPEVRAAMGPIMGRITMAEIIAGNVPAEMAPLSALLKQEYALQTTAHGWRAFEAPVAFERAIGGLRTNPDALKAGIMASGDAMTAIANPAASRIPKAIQDKLPKVFPKPGQHPFFSQFGGQATQ